MTDTVAAHRQKLHVCLVAYSCTPGRGSEEGVGWGWTRGLSNHVDLTLITRKNNVASIRKALAAEEIRCRVRTVGVDFPIWLRFWKRGARGAMLYHYFWQLLAALTARKLNKTSPFDLLHHLNFSVSWQPCWLALVGRCVYGPIDGAGIIPPAFWRSIGAPGTLKEWSRSLIVWCGEHLDPFVRLSRQRIGVLVFRTELAATRFPDIPPATHFFIPDTGLEDIEMRQMGLLASEAAAEKTGIDIIFMGRLVARKGLGLVLKGFAEAAERFNHIRLTVIGDGPEKDKMIHLGHAAGISSRVRFTGKLKRPDAWKELAKGDIFLYPSLRDAAATVVLEAMSAGLPVICLENTGPAVLLDSSTGVTVKTGSEKETVTNLANAIARLVEDASLRKQLGNNAQKAALRDHTWNARAKQMMGIYSNLVHKTPSRKEI